LFNQVKEPPTRGICISPYSKIKSENFAIVRLKQASLDLPLGKQDKLKYPPTPKKHQGKFHQIIYPANSSHKSLLSPSILILKIGPQHF
jgi:hypothetical protein